MEEMTDKNKIATKWISELEAKKEELKKNLDALNEKLIAECPGLTSVDAYGGSKYSIFRALNDEYKFFDASMHWKDFPDINRQYDLYCEVLKQNNMPAEMKEKQILKNDIEEIIQKYHRWYRIENPRIAIKEHPSETFDTAYKYITENNPIDKKIIESKKSQIEAQFNQKFPWFPEYVRLYKEFQSKNPHIPAFLNVPLDADYKAAVSLDSISEEIRKNEQYLAKTEGKLAFYINYANIRHPEFECIWKIFNYFTKNNINADDMHACYDDYFDLLDQLEALEPKNIYAEYWEQLPCSYNLLALGLGHFPKYLAEYSKIGSKVKTMGLSSDLIDEKIKNINGFSKVIKSTQKTSTEAFEKESLNIFKDISELIKCLELLVSDLKEQIIITDDGLKEDPWLNKVEELQSKYYDYKKLQWQIEDIEAELKIYYKTERIGKGTGGATTTRIDAINNYIDKACDKSEFAILLGWLSRHIKGMQLFLYKDGRSEKEFNIEFPNITNYNIKTGDNSWDAATGYIIIDNDSDIPQEVQEIFNKVTSYKKSISVRNTEQETGRFTNNKLASVELVYYLLKHYYRYGYILGNNLNINIRELLEKEFSDYTDLFNRY